MTSQKVGRSDSLRSVRFLGTLLGVFALSLVTHAGTTSLDSAPNPSVAGENGTVHFTDAQRQSAEFIAKHRSIVLTPEQKKTMDEALSSIPAPCCKQYSIATCCCPCNLAKSTWGLSKLMIVEHHANATQVNAAAREWLHFTNASGYSGDACSMGRCNQPMEQNGCGGM